jgi:hypothetical protein
MRHTALRNIIYTLFILLGATAFVYSALYAINREEVHTCYKLQSQYREAPFTYSAWEATNQQRAKLDEEMCKVHSIDIHDTLTN